MTTHQSVSWVNWLIPDIRTDLLLSWCVFFFPIGLILYAPLAEAILIIVLGVGMRRCITEGLKMSRPAGILAGFFVLFFVSIVLSIWTSQDPGAGISELGSNVHFLLAPLVVFALDGRSMKRLLVHGVSIALIVGFLLALIQYYGLNIARAEAGATSSTLFAFLMIAFALLHWVNVTFQNGLVQGASHLSSQHRLSTRDVFNAGLFCAGIYAALLSQTRNAWLLMLLAPMLICFTLRDSSHINRKRWLFHIYSLIIFSVAIYLLNGDLLARITLTISNLNASFQEAGSDSSVGQRLAMWRGGLASMPDMPLLFGYGIHQTNLTAADYLPATQPALELIRHHEHLHNDYLNTIVGLGVCGMIIFLSLLIGSIIYFHNQNRSGSIHRQAYAVMGLAIVFSMAIFALTDSFYTSSVMRSFWVLFWAVFVVSKD